jgi:hypothetical protein
LKEGLHAAQSVDLFTAGSAPLKMMGHRTGSPGIEGTVEVGAETVASEEADHNRYWTPAPGADILTPS